VLTISRSVNTILLFLVILLIITLPYDYILLNHSLITNQAVYQVLLTLRNYIPFTVVLITLKLLGVGIRLNLKELGLRFCKFRYLILSGLIPYAIYSIGVTYALLIGLNVVNPLIPLYEEYGAKIHPGSELLMLTLSLLSTLFVGSTVLGLIMLGQEVGWRGLLLSEFSKVFKNDILSSLLVGVVWGLWYTPLIILYGFYFPNHRDLTGVLLMVLTCMSLSTLLSYVKYRFNTLLTPAAVSGVLNGLHNLMVRTVVVDELYSMPTGLLGITSATTLTLILYLVRRPNRV